MTTVSAASVQRDLETRGYHIARGRLSPATRSALRENWEQAYALHRRGDAPKDRFISVLTPYLQEFYRNEDLLDAVSEILGDDIAVYFSRLMTKDATWSGAVPPHQEAPYFHGGLRKIMCFCPIGPMNRENGGLYLIEGSHKYGFLGRVNDHEIRLADFPELEKVHVEVDLGDVILFDYLLWHGSDAAEQVSVRPLYHVVYQPASDGSHYGSEPILARGTWRTRHFLPFHHGVIDRARQASTERVPPEDERFDPSTARTELVVPASAMHPDEGQAYYARLDDLEAGLPRRLVSDKEGTSRLVLLEDGVPLDAGHSPHADIRERGRGRYSHWDDAILFATSDNTDPRINGRSYALRVAF